MALNILLLIIAIFAIIVGVYFWYKYRNPTPVINGATAIGSSNLPPQILKSNAQVPDDIDDVHVSTTFQPTKRVSFSGIPNTDTPSARHLLTTRHRRNPVSALHSPNLNVVDLADMRTQSVGSESDIPTSDNNRWDAQFGKPLVRASQRRKFNDKMRKEHREHQKSFSKFNRYMMDDKAVIKTNTSLNLFRDPKASKRFQDRPIGDIYDSIVAPPRARPKKVSHKKGSTVMYDDDEEANSGELRGTHFKCFDERDETFGKAKFEDQF